jgi:hypothetical protein
MLSLEFRDIVTQMGYSAGPQAPSSLYFALFRMRLVGPGTYTWQHLAGTIPGLRRNRKDAQDDGGGFQDLFGDMRFEGAL